MIVLAWVLGIIGYFAIGIVGVAVALRFDVLDDADAEFMVPVAIIFWPIFGLVTAAEGVGHLMANAGTRLAELARPKPEVVRELPIEDDTNWTPPPSR